MELENEPTSNSEPDQTNLAWERLSKGKERALDNEPKPKENMGLSEYRVYATGMWVKGIDQ